MLNPFEVFPRMVTIEDGLDDFCYNIVDAVSPFLYHQPYSLMEPYAPSRRTNRKRNDKYMISLNIGKTYEMNNILTKIEDRKLKVSGKAVESLKNGSNEHQFERQYDIPENVLLDTMKTELSPNGTLHIAFNKKCEEIKQEIEDISKEDEFKIKVHFKGYNPNELSVRVAENNIIVEGTRKSQYASESGNTQSVSSGYISRTVRLPLEVQSDKLRAVIASDGCLEIFAPKDPNRVRPTERKLQIETS
ncbi:hypothetical protein HZS_1675 [Henneguya salminicola]|nr:hypothetical protein HZS_1675 [Henneguya salminicola]